MFGIDTGAWAYVFYTQALYGWPLLWTLAVFAATFIMYKLAGLVLHVKWLKMHFTGVPGPTDRHWFYGHLHLFPKTPGDRIRFILGLGARFRRYFCLWMGPARVTLVVNHPTTVKAVMKTSEPKPTGFSGMYRFGLPWLGPGLLIAEGARWSRSRRLLTPAFHFDILKPYVQVYNEAVQKLIVNLDSVTDTKESFEVFSHVSRLTLDIILRCAFSYETDCQAPGEPHPYLTAVSELADVWWAREKRPLLYYDWIFNMTEMGRKFKQGCDYVHKIAEDVIHKRKSALESSTGCSDRKYLDFLDILLTAKDAHGCSMSLFDIRNEVDTFMFEGHDTTASSISWTLYALAKHPEYQLRAQQEIDDILQDRYSDDITWADLNRLDYLTMCIKESLRNYSPVPFIQREFTHDFEIEGRKFPAGTPVTVHIYGVHHNSDVWENPMEYIPERFSKENVAKMDSYQFVPFSAGPRFRFILDPNHKVEKKIAAVLKAENGIRMYCERRDLSK